MKKKKPSRWYAFIAFVVVGLAIYAFASLGGTSPDTRAGAVTAQSSPTPPPVGSYEWCLVQIAELNVQAGIYNDALTDLEYQAIDPTFLADVAKIYSDNRTRVNRECGPLEETP